MKYRAKNNLGAWVYGILLYDMYGAYIDSGQGKFKIELLTVQRLAGYDTEGNEVYKSVRLWK